jgi:hypothetical protein
LGWEVLSTVVGVDFEAFIAAFRLLSRAETMADVLKPSRRTFGGCMMYDGVRLDMDRVL